MRIRKVCIRTALMALLAAIGLYGCSKVGNDDSSSESNALGNGGGTVVEVEYTPQWEEELYLKVTETEYDFSKEVIIVDNQGNTYTPEVTNNNVEFGKVGSYEIEYTFEEIVLTQKVYVLDVPTITVDESVSTTWNYVDVQTQLFKGVTAKDSLGNTLSVGLIDGGEGSLYKNGVALVGQHTVEYFVADRAGNFVVVERTITVEQNELAPTIVDDLEIDVADAKLCIQAELNAQPISLIKINNTQVNYELSQDGILINVSEIVDVIGKEAGEVCLVTAKGAVFKEIRVFDNKDPELNLFGQNNYVYKMNVAAPLPNVTKKYALQEFSLEYKLFDPNGKEVATNGLMFTATMVGNYTFQVIPIKNQTPITSKIANLTLQVYPDAQYDSLVASCTSLQYRDQLELIGQSSNYVKEGGYIEYGYSETLGEGAYTFYQDRTGVWGGYKLGGGIDAKYKKIVFDFYYEDAESLKRPGAIAAYVSLYAGDTKYMLMGETNFRNTLFNENKTEAQREECRYANYYDAVKIYTRDSSGKIRYVNPHMSTSEGKNMWLTVEVSLEKYHGYTDRLYLLNEYAGRYYIKNLYYSTEPIDKSDFNIDDATNSMQFGNFEGIGEAYKVEWPSVNVGNTFDLVYKEQIGKVKKVSFDVLFTGKMLVGLKCGIADEGDYPNKFIWSDVTSDMQANKNLRILDIYGGAGDEIYLTEGNLQQYRKWYRVEFIIPENAAYVKFKFERRGAIYIKNLTYSTSLDGNVNYGDTLIPDNEIENI